MKRSAQDGASGASPTKRQATLSVDGKCLTTFAFPSLTGISQELHDRASVFRAFFLPFTSPTQIPPFLKSFKASPICDAVDHTMTAHRFFDPEIGLDAGHDDDGERFSGKKLSDLMETMDALGLVVCIRDYGGIMLGPIRFQHITQCAREAIMAHRRLRSIHAGDMDKTRRLLVARDRTIETLRDMMILRQDEADGAPAPSSQQSVGASQQSVTGASAARRYETQKDLETLRRLLNARDLTIKSLRAKLQSIATPASASGVDGPSEPDKRANQASE